MGDVYGSVANSFGFRSISSNVAAGQAAASAVASDAIGRVSDVLGTLKGEGESALSDAAAAIQALGTFKPGTITFDYQPPDYVSATFMTPSALTGGVSTSTPSVPNFGSLTFSIKRETPDSISATPPKPYVAPEITVPQNPDSLVLPVAPKESLPDIPPTLEYITPVEPIFEQTVPPVLKPLVVPQFVAPTLPEHTLPELPEPPEPIDINAANRDGVKDYKPTFDRTEASKAHRAIVHDLIVSFSPRLQAREQFSAVSTWASRGQQLSEDTLQAQAAYRGGMTALMAAGEDTQIQIDRFMAERNATWVDAKLHAAQLREVDFTVNTLKVLETELERDEMFSGFLIEAMGTVTLVYNALVTKFRQEVALYKVGIRMELAQLEMWKASVEAEIAKTRLNSQLAQVYATTVQANIVQASLYEARVQTLLTNVSAYRSRIEAFTAQAEIARAQLAAYKATVDVYVTQLAGYKAEFQTFVAKTRSVSAKNQIESGKVAISMAEMQAASAQAQTASLSMELESEALKLQARQQGASFEYVKVHNALESISAQIQGNAGRANAIVWGSNAQIKDVQYDAAASQAQAAARYYSAASESSFRATEQAFRAILSSVQASAIAQEGAGRAAASLAQGAYSAIHANASLQGSGRVTGDEDQRASDNQRISDWLDYEQSRQAITSV